MFGVPEQEIAAIALGSNLGESKKILQGAIASLEQIGTVLRISSWYRTAPIGPEQPDYLNGCLLLHTPEPATRLMQQLLQIEDQFGRTRTIRWGARTLDLDLLLKGSEVFKSQRLTLPHPRMHERGFVLVPLAEIYPDWIHPIQHTSVTQLLSQVDCSGVKRA